MTILCSSLFLFKQNNFIDLVSEDENNENEQMEIEQIKELNDIENKKLFSDSKTHLQELVSSVSIEDVISYEIIDESGPDHDKCYEAVVKINDKVIGQGTGRNKKSAEQQAAYQALRTLDKRQ